MDKLKKIAEFMAQHLEGEVVVSPLMEEQDLQVFDRVIIGASVRYGHFNKQVYRFCRTPSRIIECKKCGLFWL